MVATKVFRTEILEPLLAESDDGKVSADAQHGQNSNASLAVCQVRGGHVLPLLREDAGGFPMRISSFATTDHDGAQKLNACHDFGELSRLCGCCGEQLGICLMATGAARLSMTEERVSVVTLGGTGANRPAQPLALRSVRVFPVPGHVAAFQRRTATLFWWLTL